MYRRYRACRAIDICRCFFLKVRNTHTSRSSNCRTSKRLAVSRMNAMLDFIVWAQSTCKERMESEKYKMKHYCLVGLESITSRLQMSLFSSIYMQNVYLFSMHVR